MEITRTPTHIHDFQSRVEEQFNVIELDEMVNGPDEAQGQEEPGQGQSCPREGSKAR